jgi:hypothetical protein
MMHVSEVKSHKQMTLSFGETRTNKKIQNFFKKYRIKSNKEPTMKSSNEKLVKLVIEYLRGY